jgi:hypothetical protein
MEIGDFDLMILDLKIGVFELVILDLKIGDFNSMILDSKIENIDSMVVDLKIQNFPKKMPLKLFFMEFSAQKLFLIQLYSVERFSCAVKTILYFKIF